MPALPDLTATWQETIGWQPDLPQLQQFQALYDLILEGNQHLNLTRITEPTEFWEKHLWDSLAGVRSLLSQATSLKVIDIGTGGGFPGLPIAIVRPDWAITLLDSTRKKIEFLKTVIDRLNLAQVGTINDRAEVVNKRSSDGGHYDLALIRAVGPAATCAAYALPFLKSGGTAILYRGQWTEAEAQELQLALKKLGGSLTEVDAFTTPMSQGIRHCLHLQKP